MNLWILIISAIALSVVLVIREIAGLRGRSYSKWVGMPVIVVLGLVSAASFLVATA